jgi:TRAP-type C4-dicarboxylate transport system permease small subunit
MPIIEKKYKKRYMIVKDVLLIALAFFFIVIGFLFASTRIDFDLQFQNIRFGLVAFALIISGTYLIVQVYRKTRK